MNDLDILEGDFSFLDSSFSKFRNEQIVKKAQYQLISSFSQMPKSRQISLFTDARSTMPQRSNEEFAPRVDIRNILLTVVDCRLFHPGSNLWTVSEIIE